MDEKINESFMMTLNKKTLDFLVAWYGLPRQEVLRMLAAVRLGELTTKARATKETQQ